jgi:hypothetical protein
MSAGTSSICTSRAILRQVGRLTTVFRPIVLCYGMNSLGFSNCSGEFRWLTKFDATMSLRDGLDVQGR